MVCTVFGAQQHAVTVEAGQSARVLSVVVGAVTVRVHSSAALRCHLLAWNRAQALAVILDEPEELTAGTWRLSTAHRRSGPARLAAGTVCR